MIKTSIQLKDLIRNLSKENGIEQHILIRKYMMERFLERVSKSAYNDSFILKGGLLVSAFIGVELRATMDIDTTIKGLPLNVSEIEKIITEISAINLNDNVSFKIKKLDEIMEEAEYSGIRVSMEALLDGARIPLKIDISTGDVITPREIVYSYKLMFEDREISIMTYPIETVLAEKLETVISRSVTNTRMRDFYDMHLLLKLQKIDSEILSTALEKTAIQRGSLKLLENAEIVLKSVENDDTIKKLWEEYQEKYSYAKDYTFIDVMSSIRKLSIEAGLNVKKPSILANIKQGVKNDERSTKKSKDIEFER